MLQLSPRVALITLPLPPDMNVSEAEFATQAGPLLAPMALLPMKPDQGGRVLLLVRQQPGLAAGGQLRLALAHAALAAFTLHPTAQAAELLGTDSPAALLTLLHFIANRALGSLRARADAELAATCHALAMAAALPATPPLAICGSALALWPLPPASGTQSAYLLTPERIASAASRSGQALLLERGPSDAMLLLPGATAPMRLGAATSATPALAEMLGRQGEAGALYRVGLAELAQANNADPRAARQLRAMAALTPTESPKVMADPQRPVGGALEQAVDDHGGGLFLRGWLRDPLELIESVHLRSAFQEEVLPAALRHSLPRPDVTKSFHQAPHGAASPRPGFVAWLPEATRLPQAQWTMRLTLRTGEKLDLLAPPGLLPPHQARDAMLSAVPVNALTESMLDDCIVPAISRVHAAFLAGRSAPEVVRIGTPAAKPAVSVVVPLYRNLRFVRFQVGHFARDPGMRDAELIYVLDSPEQRPELEHLLRALYAVYQLPITLVVQAGNYGFASASNAGAVAARAPRLLMLNSDVIPASRHWLPPLLAALDTNPALAAVGPKLLNEDGSTQHAGLFFERFGTLDEWFNDHYWKGAPRHFPPVMKPRIVPAITGAAMLLDRARFEAVAGFSTEYVIGDYEDSDLCLKLRAAGGEILYEPTAELYHFERQSIRDHVVHDRNIATAFNRRLHHARWDGAIEALMARPEFQLVQPGGLG